MLGHLEHPTFPAQLFLIHTLVSSHGSSGLRVKARFPEGVVLEGTGTALALALAIAQALAQAVVLALAWALTLTWYGPS